MITLLTESVESLHNCKELMKMFPETLDLSLTPQSPSLLSPIISNATNECLEGAINEFVKWKTCLCNQLKFVVDTSVMYENGKKFYFSTK